MHPCDYFGGRLVRPTWLTALLLASAAAHANTPEMADLTLEQLSSIRVVSVSKRQESLAQAAASIYVITREDIRRAGANSLPEVLRLAPNLQVARIDATQYAISARGFNSATANKLLVQIDGRSIYTPLYSGVFWDIQDVLLEDIERIEVISGSGATNWGGNAVNGVISIVTRSASTSQGAWASAGGGSDGNSLAARYGASLGDKAAMRLYAKRDHLESSTLDNGTSANDAMQKNQAGFRADKDYADQRLTVQGDAYEARIHQAGNDSPKRASGANLLMRWSRTQSDKRVQRIRFYYDSTRRDYPGVFEQRLSIFDLDLFQSMQLGRHAIAMGGGYRLAQDHIRNSSSVAFLPADRDMRWANVFIHDEISLSPATRLSLGTRAEYNIYTHWEWMPSLRISHALSDKRQLWAALSRSVRTPSRIDTDLYGQGSSPFSLAGGPDFRSEVANAAELGYRVQATPQLSYNLTGFYQGFRQLRGAHLEGSQVVLDNSIHGHSYGIESWASYRPLPVWRLDAGLLLQRRNYHSQGVLDTATLGNDPKYQFSLRNSFSIAPRGELSLNLRHVAALPDPGVAAYSAVDIHTSWQLAPGMRVSLRIDNLLDNKHREYRASGTSAGSSEFGRSAWAALVLDL